MGIAWYDPRYDHILIIDNMMCNAIELQESYKINIKTLIKDMAILGEGIIDSIQ